MAGAAAVPPGPRRRSRLRPVRPRGRTPRGRRRTRPAPPSGRRGRHRGRRAAARRAGPAASATWSSRVAISSASPHASRVGTAISPSRCERSIRRVGSMSACHTRAGSFRLSSTTVSRNASGTGRARVLSWKPRTQAGSTVLAERPHLVVDRVERGVAVRGLPRQEHEAGHALRGVHGRRTSRRSSPSSGRRRRRARRRPRRGTRRRRPRGSRCRSPRRAAARRRGRGASRRGREPPSGRCSSSGSKERNESL